MANNKSMPVLPDDNAPFAEKVNWLLKTHGFCELLDKVVKLFEPSDQCLLKPRRSSAAASRGAR